MKKLALTLAALATVSAVASAKEVVAAPIIAVEPVVIACPEPVVPAPAWRPTGYVDTQYKYYGSDEFDSSEFGRIQFQGAIQMTPQQKLEWRVRQYNTYASKSGLSDLDGATGAGDMTQLRFRYFYNAGNLGDSKVNLTHRIQYIGTNGQGDYITDILDSNSEPLETGLFGGNRSQSIQYMARFQFAKYFDFMPEWFAASSVMLAPQYTYAWTDNNDAYNNTLGLDVYTFWNLPADIGFEFNMYPAWRSFGEDNKDSQWRMAVEAYLYYGINLMKDGAFALDFNVEGGMDPYSLKSNKKFGKLFKDVEDDTYSAYLLPSLDISYKATEHVNLYAGVAGEYRNWRHEKQSSARQWNWMPQVYAGFKTTF